MSDHNPTADRPYKDSDTSGHPIEKNLKSGATWMRALYMLISCVLLGVAHVVGTVIVVLGFFWVLITGEVNRQVQQAGQTLANYVYEIVRFLTFNTDVRPFPLGGDWPSAKREES